MKNTLIQVTQSPKALWWLISIHAVLHIWAATGLELGIDEVYYALYSKHLAMSYFDHPPMVGWLIYLTTGGNLLKSELAIRFSSILLSSGSLLVVYQLLIQFVPSKQALWGTLLFAANGYLSILSGLFILPDTGLSFFWLTSLFFGVKYFQKNKPHWLLWFGISVGLAFLSKYQAILLWPGLLAVLLLKSRSAFREKSLYLAMGISLFLVLPVLIWNVQHNFPTLTFHGERVAGDSMAFNPTHFSRFWLGQIVYQNPFVFALLAWGLVLYIKQRKWTNATYFLLFTAFHLFVLAAFNACFKETLPHWTGVVYFSVFPLAIVGLCSLAKTIVWKSFTVAAVSLTVLVLVLFKPVINQGWFLATPQGELTERGTSDFTLDMFGWKQSQRKMNDYIIDLKTKHPNLSIVAEKWFPASHLSHYIGSKHDLNTTVIGSWEDQHQFYYWNQQQPLTVGATAIYYTTNRMQRNTHQWAKENFTSHRLISEIPITRKQDTVCLGKLYLLQGYLGK